MHKGGKVLAVAYGLIVLASGCSDSDEGDAASVPPVTPAGAGADAGGGGGGDAGADVGAVTGDPGAVTLTAPAGRQWLVQGRSAKLPVSVTRPPGNNEVVTVTVLGAPAGVSGKPLALGPGITSGELEMTTTLEATQGALSGVSLQASVSSGAKATAALNAFVRGPAGALDTTFGAGGGLELPGNVTGAACDASGRLYATAQSGMKLERYTAEGAPDATFVMDDIGQTNIRGFAVVGQSVMVCGVDMSSYLVAKFDDTGKKTTSYGASGVARVVNVASTGGSLGSCAISPEGFAVFAWTAGSERRLTWVDAATGTAPATVTVWDSVLSLETAAFDAQRLTARGSTSILRFAVRGSYDTTFAQGGKLTLGVNESVLSIVQTPQALTKVVTLSNTGARRYETSGAADLTWATPAAAPPDTISATGAYQTDGKLVAAFVANGGTKVVRFLPSGALDSSFATTGSFDAALSTTRVIVQPDGRIVLTSVPGVPARRFWND
jgi:hypothetical protein